VLNGCKAFHTYPSFFVTCTDRHSENFKAMKKYYAFSLPSPYFFIKIGLKKSTFFILIVVLCLASSCKKEPTFHQDIVRCKVNGVEWEASDDRKSELIGMGTGSTDLQYYKDTRFFEVRAGIILEDNTTDQAISFYVPNLVVGENVIPYRNDVFYDELNQSGCRFYNIDTLSNIRQLNIIELDTINLSMKGEFEYAAINDCFDTVKITEGYFDLQYRF